MTNRQWLDTISAPRFDHTKKAFCEMTFPKKGVKDPLIYGKKVEDEEGWETVDSDAPEEEGYEYKTFSYTDSEYDSDGYFWETTSDDGSEWVTTNDDSSEWETEEDEDEDEDSSDEEEEADVNKRNENEENGSEDSESYKVVKDKTYWDAFWGDFTNTDFGWLYGEGTGAGCENVSEENSGVENMEVDKVGAEEAGGGESEELKKVGKDKDDAMEMSGTEEGAVDNGDKMDIDE